MYKFNYLLFSFIVSLTLIEAAPTGSVKFAYEFLEDTDNDYDLHYDQRQNGTENYRINLDGFVIAIPGITESDNHYTNFMHIFENAGFFASDDKFQPNNDNSAAGKTTYNYEKLIGLEKGSASTSNADPQDGNKKFLNKKEVVENPTQNYTNDNAYLNMQEKNADKKGRTPFHLINLLKFLPIRDHVKSPDY